MDAKVFSSRTFKLTGSNLLVLLATGLVVFALGMDYWAGRSPVELTSLTLPLVLSAAASAVLGFSMVPLLRSLKAGQVIREDGPKSHLKKAGTPTMGGIFFLPVAVLFALAWSGFSAEVVAVSALTLAYGVIGWIDDWAIIRGKSNKGITPRMKLWLQIGCGGLFCLWLIASQPADITTILLPLGFALPLGVLFWALAIFVLTAESNAVNLTDGVDGLASGTVAIALLGLGVLVSSEHPDLMLFCACLSGACLGFLVHNRNPARVFMGNTGSTALGGALAAIGLLGGSLFALLIVSGLFLVETISVIAQVSYYKATKGSDGIGKRLFKMSPFHNHLELSGWSETRIVAAFYLINGLLVSLALTFR